MIDNHRMEGGTMFRFLIIALLLFPVTVGAQSIKCPKGYQPYADRCVTQRMADYISCVEASGANRQEISEVVSAFGGEKRSTSAKGSGSGAIVQGKGSLVLDKASEKALVRKLETKWFPKGMSECTKVLDRNTRQSLRSDIKKAIEDTTIQTSGTFIPDNQPTPDTSICHGIIPANDIIL
jgi:hypothetical protein